MSYDTEPRAIELTTADGVLLRGDVVGPEDAALGVVCAHPHPLYGGDRHNPVVEALFREAARQGCRALRFDFRGGGDSPGEHGGGVTERLDVEAAIDHVARGARPVVLAGYSFGADVMLAVDHPLVIAWFAVAAPLAVGDISHPAAAADERRVWLVVPAHDQFRSPEAAQRLTEAWPSTTVEVIAMADHFMAGASARVSQLFVRALLDLTDPNR